MTERIHGHIEPNFLVFCGLSSHIAAIWRKIGFATIRIAETTEQRSGKPHASSDRAEGRSSFVVHCEPPSKEAIVWLERSRNALPESPNFRALLASAYALEGARGAATAGLAVARKLYRDGRLESIARVKAAGFHAVPGYFGVPKVGALFETTYFEGLRKAGIPEE